MFDCPFRAKAMFICGLCLKSLMKNCCLRCLMMSGLIRCCCFQILSWNYVMEYSFGLKNYGLAKYGFQYCVQVVILPLLNGCYYCLLQASLSDCSPCLFR